MPIVENIPHIDPTVRHIGVSKLRGLNAEKLRESEDTYVIEENDTPLAVLLTYDKFLAMQEQLLAVARTVEMLGDVAEMDALRVGLQDVRDNRIHTLDSIDQELKKK